MNKNLIAEKTSLFNQKLDSILNKLKAERDTIPVQTKEALIQEATRLLTLFYKTVNSAGFKAQLVSKNELVDNKKYNENLVDIQDDIKILFAELENLEGVVLEQFNLIATQANRLNSRLKRLNNQVLDFELFNQLPIKNSVFFLDSFGDSSRVEVNSPLLNAAQCSVEVGEGIATLPLLTSTLIQTSLTPTISSNSNGRAGNNEELNIVNSNSNSQVLLDGNPDTWFEYEKVSLIDDGVPLLLDIVLNLNKEEIINFIRINPNNFGTKTEVKIKNIFISTDGINFKTIKVEQLKLAPATSKYAGQAFLTFDPILAKYVRFVFEQSSPYVIETVQGPQLRYAIGLRDLELRQNVYSSQGELVSVNFDATKEISKVTVKSNQTLNNELYSIEHQVSFNQGNSWNKVNPISTKANLNQLSTGEVLNVPEEETTNILKYKAKFIRNDSAFNEASETLAEDIVQFSEIKTVPIIEPWTVELNNSPVVSSVTVLDPNYGSRGRPEGRLLLGIGTGSSAYFIIPFSDIRLDLEKDSSANISRSSIIRLFINNKEWTEVSTLVGQSSSAEVFTIREASDGNLLISFGDGTVGKAPPSNSKIEMEFTSERMMFNNSKTASLEFNISTDKSLISVVKKSTVSRNTVQLTENSQVHKLPHKNILISSTYPISFTNPDGAFTTRQTFLNGQVSPTGELTATGDYSVDATRGIIYSFDRTDTTPGTVTYFFQEEQELPQVGYEIKSSKEVLIKDEYWKPTKVAGYSPSTGITKIKLPHFNVLNLSFQGLTSVADSLNPFLQEVPFVNGSTELSNYVKTEENILNLNPIANKASFTLSHKIQNLTILGTGFSNTELFSSEQSSTLDVDAAGKYHINRSTSVITVYTTTAIADAGTVIYYYQDAVNYKQGVFSVDYKNGEIYLQRVLPAGVTVNYEYADYYIKYNIARKLNSSEFTVNNKVVSINPSEVFRKFKLSSVKQNVYQIDYKYIKARSVNLAELAKYYTPVLRDYTLQVIPRDLL